MNDTGRDFEFKFPSTHVSADVNASTLNNDLRLWTLQLASRLSGLKTTEEIEILVNEHAPGNHHILHRDSVSIDVGSRQIITSP